MNSVARVRPRAAALCARSAGWCWLVRAPLPTAPSCSPLRDCFDARDHEIFIRFAISLEGDSPETSVMSCFVVRAAARRLHERARRILPFRTWSRLRKPVTGLALFTRTSSLAVFMRLCGIRRNPRVR